MASSPSRGRTFTLGVLHGYRKRTERDSATRRHTVAPLEEGHRLHHPVLGAHRTGVLLLPALPREAWAGADTADRRGDAGTGEAQGGRAGQNAGLDK